MVCVANTGMEQPFAIALFPALVSADATEDFFASLAKWRRADPILAVETAARLGLQLPKRTPDGAAALPLAPSPHAALILLRGGREHATAQFAALIARLAPMMDLDASAAIAGAEHIVKPESGRVIVTMLVNRLPALSRPAFSERWRVGHAPFGRRIAAPGYRQLHADAPAETVAAMQRTGLLGVNAYDGVGCVMFASLEGMRAARAAPEVTRDATADEMQFIDHSRSILMAFERC